MSIVITAWKYLFEKSFNEQTFEHCDARLMEKQTKIAISVARQLYAKVKGDEIQSEYLGVVLLNDIGPLVSIFDYNSTLKEKGYIGINPSKFPNIMSASTLSRIAIEVGAKGSCVPLLSSKSNKHALIYAIEQVTAGRCLAMMLIHIFRRNDCFGCLIEEENYCHMRSIEPRLTMVKQL